MTRVSRRRALGATVSILVALVMVPTFRITPALASIYTTCGKHLGVKTTLISIGGAWDITVAEVNGEAGLTTQGTGDCWDRGVWNFLYHTDASRCYDGAAWLEMTGCFRDPLTGGYWWTDSSGTRRYYNMDQHTYGNYKNVDPTSSQSGTTFTLHSRFTIRYDGTYTYNCNLTGTQPFATRVDCHNTGIQSGR
jgi:hypothetical protein